MDKIQEQLEVINAILGQRGPRSSEKKIADKHALKQATFICEYLGRATTGPEFDFLVMDLSAEFFLAILEAQALMAAESVVGK